MKNLNRAFFILILLAFGCKDNSSKDISSEKKERIDKNLKTILDNYIEVSPLKLNRILGKSSIESNSSYPSYHLFFKKNKNDTVFSIVQFPSYNNFELEGTSGDDKNDSIYRSIDHKGWIMYKDKYPLIIFDDKNYSAGLIQSDDLILKIPDSLKAGTEHQHIKFVKWDYQIDNNNLKKIDLSN